jgi:hypothetical protein
MNNQKKTLPNIAQLTTTSSLNVKSYDVNILNMNLGSNARLQVRLYDASDNYIGLRIVDVSGIDYQDIFGSNTLILAENKVQNMLNLN